MDTPKEGDIVRFELANGTHCDGHIISAEPHPTGGWEMITVRIVFAKDGFEVAITEKTE
jgi:hypothetical protein